jgi:hypothetical protein
MRLSFLLLVTVPVVFLHAPAHADTIKYCLSTWADFNDSGVPLTNGTTEDNWVNPGTAQKLRGAKTVIYDTSHVFFDGYLGDGFGSGDPGIGCTPVLTIPSSTWYVMVYVEAKGSVQGNTVSTHLMISPNYVQNTTFYTTYNGQSGQTVPLTFLPEGSTLHKVFRVQNAASYALYRHAGGVTAEQFKVLIWEDTDPARRNYFNGVETEITTTGSTKKFLVTHEFGHNVIRFATSMPNGSCAYSVPSGSACASSSHNIGSKEYQGCAFDEGGAHFYSADIWNDHNATDCSFKYYKNMGGNPAEPVIDCEASGGDFSSGMSVPVDYLESVCPSPFAGFGVEVDWLRGFWDVHTNQTVDPTFNDIKNWWDTSDGWTDTTVYAALNAGDENYATIDPVWESIATLNGINP